MCYTVLVGFVGVMQMAAEKISGERIASLCTTRDISVYAYDTLSSTNDEARRLAASGKISLPALVISDRQTSGRGRMGRSFFSPSGTGIYMSLLFRAGESLDGTVRITTAAAVAAAMAIEKLLNIEVSIKWVNDVYVGDKKVCGILCESFASESGERFAVVGIGINLFSQEFPEELRGIAASLDAKGITREEMAACVADILCGFYENISDGAIMDYYRAHSCVLDKTVSFTESGVDRIGKAISIEDSGALVVELEGGERRTLLSGEITLRVQN